MKLRETNWWPRVWRTGNYQDFPADEVSKNGVLVRCDVWPHELMLRVNVNGTMVDGRIARNNVNAPGNLQQLLDFLADYHDDSMDMIENLEVEPDQFNRRRP